jgi:toxin ParE1/3/4
MVPGARVDHLAFSRDHVHGGKVQTPRHFPVYRRRDDGVLEVARILHDARELARHLPARLRRSQNLGIG